MKEFKDKSIFKGVVQYFDENGQEWKMEGKEVFKLIDNTWIYQGESIRKAKESLRNRHERFLEEQYISNQQEEI